MFTRTWRRARHYYAANKQLSVLSLVFLLIFIGVGAVVPIRTVYAREQGASLFEIGLMGSAFLIAQFVFQLPFGWLSDRWGRKPLLILGGVSHVLLSLAYLFAPTTFWFIVLRAVEGVSVAAELPAARAYIADITPPGKRGAAFGMFNAAMSGGILLGPAIGGFLGSQNPVTPFAFDAATGLIALIVTIVVMREPQHVQKADTAAAAPAAPFRWQMLFGVYFLAAFLMAFARQFIESLFGSLWNIALLDHGWTLDMIGLTYSVFGIPSLLLMVYGGQVADRSRHRALLYGGCGLAIAAIYVSYGPALAFFLPLLALDALEAILSSFAWPIADRFVATISPENGRGRVQAVYGVTGTVGGVIGTYIGTTTYAIGALIPFFIYGGVQVVNAIVSSTAMARFERRHPAAAPDVTAVESASAPLIPASVEQ